jgi:hypothetical protein
VADCGDEGGFTGTDQACKLGLEVGNAAVGGVIEVHRGSLHRFLADDDRGEGDSGQLVMFVRSQAK